jgi:hypothetical protein
MNGIPEFFGSGPNSIPISPDEIQFVSLIGFILVGLIYSCGSSNLTRERVLRIMLESRAGHPQLLKAVSFVADALKKDPAQTYKRWLIDRSEFKDIRKRFKAMQSE